MALSSDAPPLCPRFLPGMWKPKEVADLFPGWASEESPKRAKMPFFLGLASSWRPTSSKFSSSVELGFSKLLERMAGEATREKRESSEVREGSASEWVIGDRAEMSWSTVSATLFQMWCSHVGGLTIIQMIGGTSRRTRAILKRAHSRRRGRDGWTIAQSLGTGARSSASRVEKAVSH